MALATAAAVVFLALFALDLAGYLTNPYLGLLVFVTVPALFVLALLLIPIGAWWTARRRRHGQPPPDWPIIDLRHPRQRNTLVAVLALTVVNVAIVSMGAYGGVHYLESDGFCGQVCHVTMRPQAVAHKVWPHANVSCVQCHVGPGAGAYVEGKLAGTRQLLHVLTDRVPTPVPSPRRLIQPAVVACAQCHSSSARSGDELRVIRDYTSDEASTENTTTLRLRVGDQRSGIHRHIAMRIEYVPGADAAATIPIVRLRTAEGVREYVAEAAATGAAATAAGATGADAAEGGAAVATMECIDCHNRPAHSFSATPERAIDAAIAAGGIPRALPFVRRETVAAIGADYDSEQAALAGIASRLNGFYAGQSGVDAALVRRAVAGAQAAWSRNVFPAMKVTWGTYPNHIGHVDAPGCFRCHDDRKAVGGATVSQDCELCHTLPE